MFNERNDAINICFWIIGIAMVLMTVITFIFIEHKHDEFTQMAVKQAAFYDEVENKIDNGYKVFLDGSEIDGNSIDVRLYEVKCSDEKKSVYLTKKRDITYNVNNSRRYTPVIPFGGMFIY